MSRLRVRELFVYPLKSTAGLRVAASHLDDLGMAGDRRWMAVDAHGRFLSQRQIPRMALIQATGLEDDGLYLSAADHPSLHVRRPGAAAADITVTVWQDTVTARDGGDEAARWISTVLASDARLAYCPPSRARVVDPAYASGERVGFADAFPLLVLGEATLREINDRLAARQHAAVGIERFRPNVVIEGGEPFEEDSWRLLEIGEGSAAVHLALVKPCARCSTISVDPHTGTQTPEPMRTLATYRLRDGDVYVGQNALIRRPGRLITGAPVRVLG